MRGFNFKLILLIGLFVALVVKGGQLCTAEGVQAMTRLVDSTPTPVVDPLPLKPEEDFRGVSPLPELVARVNPVHKVVRTAGTHKPSKAPLAAKSAAPAKPAKKS